MMNDENPNPRPPQDSAVDLVSLERVANAIDGLVVFTRAAFSRALLGMGALVGVSVLIAIATSWMLVRTYAQADRSEAMLGQLELVLAEQTQAKAATEEVKQKVDVAAAAAAEKPDITIAPATTAMPGMKAKGAVLVIKAARRPATSSASAAPPAPEIRIPVQLPPSATAVPGPPPAGSATP